MIQLIAGSFLLSLLHAAIPNHWLPLVLIGRNEGWSKQETLFIAGIAGLAHTLSTIGLGIIIGFIGVQLAKEYALFTTIVAPLILIFMGLVYFGLDLVRSHHQHLPDTKQLAKKPKWSIVVTISITMFFSPCLEIETFYLTAGKYGWLGIAIISGIYLVITISGIICLVALGGKGLQRMNLHQLEHHEKKITSSMLILLGIFSYFIQ